MKLVRSRGQIVLDESLSADSLTVDALLALVVNFAPDVGARVLDRARVVRVRRYLVIDVVVAQRDIIPAAGVELTNRQITVTELGQRPEAFHYSFDRVVNQENVVLR